MGKGLKQIFLQRRYMSKNVKRCSTSLFLREMQITTMMRYHFAPIRMALIGGKNSQKIITVVEDVEELETPGHCLWVVPQNIKHRITVMTQ